LLEPEAKLAAANAGAVASTFTREITKPAQTCRGAALRGAGALSLSGGPRAVQHWGWPVDALEHRTAV